MIDVPLNYEDIRGKVGCLEFKFEFKFGVSTAYTFNQCIQSIPWGKDGEKLPVIDFGDSLEDTDLNIILLLIKNAKNRVTIQIGNIEINQNVWDLIT